MLKNPHGGWAELNFEGKIGDVSYLTDVLEDIVEAAELYIATKKFPVCIRFDLEEFGTWLLLVDYSNTILITEGTEEDCWDCKGKWIDGKDTLLELLGDLKSQLHDWVYHFELWDDSEVTEEQLGGWYEQKENEYRERIDDAIAKITKIKEDWTQYIQEEREKIRTYQEAKKKELGNAQNN
jgi:hypothetical protein